jgi:leucyl-tRNA synthetase
MSTAYHFKEIETKWQEHWAEKGIDKVSEDKTKPKYYVLDMFPYPSGAGLHVGHPLGYIASDIIARYKKLQGFNVLHPMGFDAFGLPAEQYAIDHGIHPAESTEKNIQTFKNQLKNIGFSYDWSREIKTCDPNYYKWTQWIFTQLYNSFYDRITQKATPIAYLKEAFILDGNSNNICPVNDELQFSATDWQNYSTKDKEDILMQYRLAYLSFADVWWCEKLGTVLANDEVVNGVSERGGHPVIRKKMRQWFLRITEYADRLISGLETVDFSDALKEMQRNWIGKSHGCELNFEIANSSESLKIYTTRPDTIFGADFMVIAPEHTLIERITSTEQKADIEAYIQYVKSRSELERQSDITSITGCFTGAYVIHPFSKRRLPIWTAEYVLAGYGTGAIMAVPCGDERDFAFANNFNIPITNIIGDSFDGKEANSSKEVTIRNSDFISDLSAKQAMKLVNEKVLALGIGKPKTNFRLRDAGFSRQRYWGEPFPVIFNADGAVELVKETELPVALPNLSNFGPGPDGQGPLANLTDWVNLDNGKSRETNTMPGYAGSSWYFLRYMDPLNELSFCGRSESDYWEQVDLYVGGSEHAVGHLLYSRFWTKVLYDLDFIGFEEPYKKLLNQGKIGGDSRLAYRIHGTNTFVSAGLVEQYQVDEIHVDINFVNGLEMDTNAFINWRPEFNSAKFELENGKYICGSRLEKMGKRFFNVVNPDDVVNQYGADSLRMYEMFLGPIEDSKPWNINGIDGVHRFLKKLWRICVDAEGDSILDDSTAQPESLKTLHQTIKKITEDLEKLSFNTSISAFMICVNELSTQNCKSKSIINDFLQLLAPYAPHIAEELWHKNGNNESIFISKWPMFNSSYLVESTKLYPVSINGKVRTQLEFSLDLTIPAIEKEVMANEIVVKWLEGKTPKKVIIVPGKIINIVM